MRSGLAYVFVGVAMWFGRASSGQQLPLLTAGGSSDLTPQPLARLTQVVPREGRIEDVLAIVMPRQVGGAQASAEYGVGADVQLQVYLGPSVEAGDHIKNYVAGVSGEILVDRPGSSRWSLRVNDFLRFVPIVLFDRLTDTVSLRAPVELAHSSDFAESIRASLAIDGYLSGSTVVWRDARLWQDHVLAVGVPGLRPLDGLAPGRTRSLPSATVAGADTHGTGPESAQSPYRCCRSGYDRCVIVEGTCSPWPCDPYCDVCGFVDFDCSCPNTCFF